ncbi:unnamed protein product [Ilex paraguariensis]|uniref:Wound-induced protein 1 n=1 Tax=Ilex paraguariensis TaxID=185542 RepID=A0ABC8T816_9AQUA
MGIHLHHSPAPDFESRNKKLIKVLYKSLARRDVETVAPLLASDLEWWYHGPPHCQHMMRTLTGKSSHAEFKFRPRTIKSVGETLVIAEGWEGSKAYWVHVWTLRDDKITRFREYFNTWLTVLVHDSEDGSQSLKLWQSGEPEGTSRSLPQLVLAI